MAILPDAVGPPDWADIGLLPPQDDSGGTASLARRLRLDGWLALGPSRRVALSLPRDRRHQVDAILEAQLQGVSALALCPSPPALPASSELAAAFSAAVYPYRR
jgi:hypothetical protein